MKAYVIVHDKMPLGNDDVWKEDRDLASRSGNARLMRYADLTMPVARQIEYFLYDVNGEFVRYVQSPASTFDLQKSAKAVTARLQNEWGIPLPEVKFVPPEQMLETINRNTRAVNTRLPKRLAAPDFKVPVTGIYNGYFDELTMSGQYILIIQRPGVDVRSMHLHTQTTVYMPWHQEEFDVTLAEFLNYAAFRRLRGETAQEYLRTVRQTNPIMSNPLRKALSQDVNYKTFRDSPENALPLLNSRTGIWTDELERSTYMTVRPLEELYTTPVLAMDDVISYHPHMGIFMYLDPRHPTYSERRSRLEAARQGDVKEIDLPFPF